MIRKHKKFVRPKKAYEKARMEGENKLIEKYGLKNKREIWKMLAKVNYFRRRAKSLAKSSYEEQESFFKKLQEKGLKVSSIADVLALTIDDLINRRLQTIVFSKGMANTMLHARQMIVHKKILVNGNALNIPSYIVSVSEEESISSKSKKESKKKIKEEVKEVPEDAKSN